MKKLLHIIATPREEESRTLQVAKAFLDSFHAKNPGCVLEEVNLFKTKLSELSAEKANGKYALLSGSDLSGKLKEAWEPILRQIEIFLSADVYLITVPMWNFSIPYVLKHYIDLIVQPKYLFRYTAQGPEGLVRGRKMAVITSRGGDYSLPQSRAFDFQEPYLKMVFGFVGITDMSFIHAQPMDALGPDVRKRKIEEACAAASSLGRSF